MYLVSFHLVCLVSFQRRNLEALGHLVDLLLGDGFRLSAPGLKFRAGALCRK